MLEDSPLINLDESKKKGVLKKKPLLEKHIEKPVCRYAKNTHHMIAEKFTSPAKRSVPDQLFTTVHGVIFFIEFKAPGEVPTEKQGKDHKKRRDKGCLVFVVDDIDQGKAIIDLMASFRLQYN